jgi:hypothetical protein
MQRMHHLGLIAGSTLLIHALVGSTASAALLRPNDTREYPDVTAFANGYQSYTYNPQTQTGVFQLSNVPFLLTSGTTANGGFVESNIGATTDNLQSQTLTAVLDQNGNLVSSPLNSFQVYGTVVIGGQTYTGLLLSGTPTAFGSQTLKPLVNNEDLFDLTLKITGGTLASLYGPEAYVRVTSEANSTFDGIFTTDFSSEKVLTNTHPVSSLNAPSPVPEPAALFVLLACGAGLFYRGRRRIAPSDLAVSH